MRIRITNRSNHLKVFRTKVGKEVPIKIGKSEEFTVGDRVGELLRGGALKGNYLFEQLETVAADEEAPAPVRKPAPPKLTMTALEALEIVTAPGGVTYQKALNAVNAALGAGALGPRPTKEKMLEALTNAAASQMPIPEDKPAADDGDGTDDDASGDDADDATGDDEPTETEGERKTREKAEAKAAAIAATKAAMEGGKGGAAGGQPKKQVADKGRAENKARTTRVQLNDARKAKGETKAEPEAKKRKPVIEEQ